MDSTDDTVEPALSPAAQREWEEHLEHVLRGVGHALNNRAASVSAVMELSFEPDQGGVPTRALLAAEVQRLRELAEVVRTVGLPRGAAEAFVPAEAASAARVVLSLHAELRERAIVIDATGAPPVRGRKWLLVRALVSLAADASARHSGAPVAITMREDGPWLTVAVNVDTGAAPPAARASSYVRDAAAALGGEPLPAALGFRMPTLAEFRRREGR